MEPKITFIIPTIGRDTLVNTIASLEQQTNDKWKAIIIFDGIESNITNDNPKIKIITIEKSGKDANSAGNVRNKGIPYVTTEWVGFIDDDDVISNDYVDTFYKEIEYKVDVIIFRMIYEDNYVLPPLETDNFYINQVGISFVLKTNLLKKYNFIPSSAEDYDLLNRLRENDYKIMISPYIRYYVRTVKDDNTVGNRLFINVKEGFESTKTNSIYILLFLFFIAFCIHNTYILALALIILFYMCISYKELFRY